MRSKREKYQRAYIQLTGKGQALYVLSRSSDCNKLLTAYHVLSLSACVTPALSLPRWKVVWKGKWHFCALPGWVGMGKAGEAHALSQGCSGGGGGLYLPLFFIFSELQIGNSLSALDQCIGWLEFLMMSDFPLCSYTDLGVRGLACGSQKS